MVRWALRCLGLVAIALLCAAGPSPDPALASHEGAPTSGLQTTMGSAMPAHSPALAAGGAPTGKVKLGRRKLQGVCDKKDIKAVLLDRVGALRACYEKGLERDPRLGGKVIATWVIRMEGDTRTLRLPSNALGAGPATDCITRVLSRMRFKAPERGVCLVEQPLTFSVAP
jgi:hypothetical protein